LGDADLDVGADQAGLLGVGWGGCGPIAEGHYQW
jgi:hypothetical protein